MHGPVIWHDHRPRTRWCAVSVPSELRRQAEHLGADRNRPVLLARPEMIRPALTHLPIIGIAALLSACAAPAGRTPADSPAAVGAARLSCFSAELPDSGGSCDEFCATRDAACVATGVGKGTLILPLPSCGD